MGKMLALHEIDLGLIPGTPKALELHQEKAHTLPSYKKRILGIRESAQRCGIICLAYSKP